MLFRFSIFLLCLLLTGCSKKEDSNQTVKSKMTGKVVFRYEDAKNDDRGMGHYIYPIELQDQKPGIFDMRTFTVRDLGELLEFEIEFNRPIDRQTVGGYFFQKGFAYQMIDIYIDTNNQRNEGLTRALPGRNLEFLEDEAWDKAIVITPGSSRDIDEYFAEGSEYRDFYEIRRSIIAPDDVYVSTYSITARVRKSDIGEPNSSWGYQVCVLGYNQNNLGLNALYNMKVNTFASESAFGGGSDYEGNTNVIDILSPTKEAQYEVLSRFRSNPNFENNILAILPMIYQKDKQKIEKSRNSVLDSNTNRQSVDLLVEPRYLK